MNFLLTFNENYPLISALLQTYASVIAFLLGVAIAGIFSYFKGHDDGFNAGVEWTKG